MSSRPLPSEDPIFESLLQSITGTKIYEKSTSVHVLQQIRTKVVTVPDSSEEEITVSANTVQVDFSDAPTYNFAYKRERESLICSVISNLLENSDQKINTVNNSLTFKKLMFSMVRRSRRGVPNRLIFNSQGLNVLFGQKDFFVPKEIFDDTTNFFNLQQICVDKYTQNKDYPPFVLLGYNSDKSFDAGLNLCFERNNRQFKTLLVNNVTDKYWARLV